ncbi:MAG: hypothetical protein Q8L26_05225 [Candidatus Omnitrophota bacterium]|nr:hypothetical protein [Candidatus Omnitrophota bacterium]
MRDSIKQAILFYILFFVFGFLCASAEEQFVYNAKRKRDPMMPLVTPQGLIRDIKSLGAQEDLVLEGIIYDAQGKSLAIINGQIIKAGDSLGKIKILDIREDKVIILKDDNVSEIKLE